MFKRRKVWLSGTESSKQFRQGLLLQTGCAPIHGRQWLARLACWEGRVPGVPDFFHGWADLLRRESGQQEEVGLAERVLPKVGKDEFQESLTFSTDGLTYRVAAKAGQGSRTP